MPAQAVAISTAFKDATGEAEIVTKKDLAVAEIKSEMSVVKWMTGAVFGLAIANFAKQYVW